MKLAMILGNFHRDYQGGAEIQAKLLAERFLDRGHQVVYICNGESGSGPEIVDGIRLYRLKKPWRGIKALNYLNRRKLYGILDDESPDVLYQRGDYHFVDLVPSYGRSRKIPSAAGLSMERHSEKPAIRGWRTAGLDLLNRFLVTRYYRRSDMVICQTEHQRRNMKRNFGVDPVIVPNGHPVPEGPFVKEDPPVISWVANIKPIKNPAAFIETAGRFGEGEARFLMIGRMMDGSLRSTVMDGMKKIPSLDYLGERSLGETNRILASSTALVNTSDSEGFSNTFIQAWMRETPVVSLNADPDSVITNEGLGFLSGDPDKMEDDIRRLIGNRDLVANIGRRSRRYAVEKYDIIRIADRYIELFEKMATDGGVSA
jgi:glycosyltransferase involved in cell wall biosynthesis